MSGPDQLGLPLDDEPPHPAVGRSAASRPVVRALAARRPAGRSERALPRILAVGELTRHIKSTLRAAPQLRDVWVEGEVGQVSVSSAGHCYFTLKDERAQLRCDDLPRRPDGHPVPATDRHPAGRPRARRRVRAQGVYQLYVDTLQPAGFGDLALRFEALKAQLTQEGLFEASRKRPLPPWPRTIGVCTSLSGAVLHDIRKVLARRWPSVRVIVSACQVQGPGAPGEHRGGAATGWPLDGRRRPAARSDLVILARGGGSLEDLWAFNEEVVVRAVAAVPCRSSWASATRRT